MTRKSHDWNAGEFDREEYDHGTDEYVSACNRLPFSEPAGKSESVNKEEAPYWALTCLALSAVLCGCAYGGYKLIELLIH